MHITIDGRPVALTLDATGYSAFATIDEKRYLINVTVTPMSPR